MLIKEESMRTGEAIIKSPVKSGITISKVGPNQWNVAPHIAVFPAPKTAIPKNIIFLLDNSRSMDEHDTLRLKKVKAATSKFLDKLVPHSEEKKSVPDAHSKDTFTIVTFNDDAVEEVKSINATKQAVKDAKDRVNSLTVGGMGTRFIPAFDKVNEIIPKNTPTTVIFLTDGEGEEKKAANLLMKFDLRFLRIIPMGVCLKQESTSRQLLNDLAKLTGGGEQAIYIEDESEQTYEDAFDKAFDLAMESSRLPAQLEMVAETKKGPNSTKLQVHRVLSKVVYNGSLNTLSVPFNSPTPPCNLKVTFHCDDISLRAKHRLSDREHEELSQGHTINISIDKFKWKNNSISSWLIALSTLITGAVLLTSATLFILSSPHLSLIMLVTSVLASLVGLYLFIRGLIAVAKKTICLPTKFSSDHEKKINEAKRLAGSSNEEKKRDSENIFHHFSKISNTLYQSFPLKKVLSYSLIAGCGGVAGYFGSTAVAAKVAISIGIKASLFVNACVVGGAVILPLLAYACWQLYLSRDAVYAQVNRCLTWLPSKKVLGGGALAVGGGVAGYFGGIATAKSAAVVAMGIKASLFVSLCATGGAIVLPLLAYMCWRVRDNLPSKRALAGCLFSAGGGVAGYFGGLATVNSTAVVATGISASLFLGVCTVGGAVALPLLIACCIYLGQMSPCRERGQVVP